MLKFSFLSSCECISFSSVLSLDTESKGLSKDIPSPTQTIWNRWAKSARATHPRAVSLTLLFPSPKVNPPYYVPLVELVPHPETAPATMDRTHALMKKIGQSPVRVLKEIDGFVLNRLQYAIISEAWRLVEVHVPCPPTPHFPQLNRTVEVTSSETLGAGKVKGHSMLLALFQRRRASVGNRMSCCSSLFKRFLSYRQSFDIRT